MEFQLRLQEIKTYVDNDGNRTGRIETLVSEMRLQTNITSIRENCQPLPSNKATYNENASKG